VPSSSRPVNLNGFVLVWPVEVVAIPLPAGDGLRLGRSGDRVMAAGEAR